MASSNSHCSLFIYFDIGIDSKTIIMTEIKKLDKGAKTFTANNVDYFISSSLSLNRFKQFEKLKIEFDLSMTLLQARLNFINIFKKLNESKPAEAAVIAHNMANAIEMQQERTHNPILYLCALFINREDEDVTKVDEQLMNEKVNDWAEEGYDIADFFTLARLLSNAFTPDLESDSENTLTTNQETENQDTSKK